VHDDEIAEINLRARHREEGQRYCVLGGVTILECPESTNLKSAKFWSNVATNMQYTPRLRPFGRSSRSKIWNSPLESCSFWAQKYANSPLTFGGASQGLTYLIDKQKHRFRLELLSRVISFAYLPSIVRIFASGSAGFEPVWTGSQKNGTPRTLDRIIGPVPSNSRTCDRTSVKFA